MSAAYGDTLVKCDAVYDTVDMTAVAYPGGFLGVRMNPSLLVGLAIFLAPRARTNA